MKEFIIYCPINKGRILLYSNMLDDMGQFTKFILWAIGKRYSLEQIDEVIELGEYIIREELLYLCKIGFLVEENDQYTLSENGKSYLSLMNVIETINHSDIRIKINYYTGEVSSANDRCFDSNGLDMDIPTLPKRVSRHFFFNKNFANAKEFLLNEYAYYFTELSEHQKESLYVILDCEKDTSYVQYVLSEIPSIASETDTQISNGSSLLLKRTVYRYKFSYIDHRLDRYRNVLPTLRSLSKFEKELLSSRSYDIILLESEEQQRTEALAPIYQDTYSDEVSDQIHASHIPHSNQRIADIHLPVRYEHLDESMMPSQWDIDHEEWSLSKSEVKSITLAQLVPFDIFVEKVDD
ncbi:hypothetical protein QYF50_02020 [Paenibacillus vini]|uniref:hypothetical protein n=1 Tax=Paenibacillus vini TaxID=1476024 RepID=UPI0025B6EDCC|nr:hypothetical protein [Paenibacillus vini]MDN4066657.1 hypothetical protein [Paenibacillus vini]